MSGGSWEYSYLKVEELATRLSHGSESPERRALGELLQRVAVALHDIEWCDSGDMSPGDDTPAILAALAPHAEQAVLAVLLEDARQVHAALGEALDRKGRR